MSGTVSFLCLLFLCFEPTLAAFDAVKKHDLRATRASISEAASSEDLEEDVNSWRRDENFGRSKPGRGEGVPEYGSTTLFVFFAFSAAFCLLQLYTIQIGKNALQTAANADTGLTMLANSALWSNFLFTALAMLETLYLSYFLWSRSSEPRGKFNGFNGTWVTLSVFIVLGHVFNMMAGALGMIAFALLKLDDSQRFMKFSGGTIAFSCFLAYYQTMLMISGATQFANRTTFSKW